MDRRRFCAALCATAFGVTRLRADDTVAGASANPLDVMNLLNQTAGGKQFWADVWFFHDWRIQSNVVSGHFRLLDGRNHRHCSGSFDECRGELDKIIERDKLPPMEGKALVLLHGLFRTRSAMTGICKCADDGGCYKTFRMGYPTTRGSVDSHAHALDSVVRSLEGMSEINFVAHSLGNLVVRHWLKNLENEQRTLPARQKFGRMVMLAPPNQHPEIAAKLIRGSVINYVAGPAATELASGWENLSPKLATPHFEFGILAGGKGDDSGYNPLIPGDDDAVVTVESTRLAGARDFRVLPVLHTFFMDDKRVQDLTLRFLEHGHFESEVTRQPIA